MGSIGAWRHTSDMRWSGEPSCLIYAVRAAFDDAVGGS